MVCSTCHQWKRKEGEGIINRVLGRKPDKEWLAKKGDDREKSLNVSQKKSSGGSYEKLFGNRIDNSSKGQKRNKETHGVKVISGTKPLTNFN